MVRSPSFVHVPALFFLTSSQATKMFHFPPLSAPRTPRTPEPHPEKPPPPSKKRKNAARNRWVASTKSVPKLPASVMTLSMAGASGRKHGLRSGGVAFPPTKNPEGGLKAGCSKNGYPQERHTEKWGPYLLCSSKLGPKMDFLGSGQVEEQLQPPGSEMFSHAQLLFTKATSRGIRVRNIPRHP